MKKILVFLMLMLFGLTVYASEVYVVTTNSLNMRAKPKGSAHKLGSLRKGEIIKVDTIINGWATCVNEAGETYYVSSKHLIKKEDAEAKRKRRMTRSMAYHQHGLCSRKLGKHWPI